MLIYTRLLPLPPTIYDLSQLSRTREQSGGWGPLMLQLVYVSGKHPTALYNIHETEKFPAFPCRRS